MVAESGSLGRPARCPHPSAPRKSDASDKSPGRNVRPARTGQMVPSTAGWCHPTDRHRSRTQRSGTPTQPAGRYSYSLEQDESITSTIALSTSAIALSTRISPDYAPQQDCFGLIWQVVRRRCRSARSICTRWGLLRCSSCLDAKLFRRCYEDVSPSGLCDYIFLVPVAYATGKYVSPSGLRN